MKQSRSKSLFLSGILLLIAPIVSAQTLPDIMGSIERNGGGSILFTTIPGEKCEPGQLTAYAKEEGGKVIGFGCYMLVGEEFLVKYQDDSVYSYPLSAVKFSEEFLQYLSEVQKNKGNRNSI
jgi:hypothetical protein